MVLVHYLISLSSHLYNYRTFLSFQGAVGVRLRMYDRILCFVNCHFAAHLEAVSRRNADFDHVYRTMAFSRQSSSLNSGAGMLRNIFLSCSVAFLAYRFWPIHWSLLLLISSIAASASVGVSMPRGGNVRTSFDCCSFFFFAIILYQSVICNFFKSLRAIFSQAVNTFEARPELSEADMIVFLGDFNYRLDDITYDETRDFISQRCFDWLREKDQLHTEMEAGNVFQGMREAIIRFPPTYKFERHHAGLAGQ